MKPLTKLIIVVVLGLGVSLTAGFYVIKPSLNKVNKMNEELRSKKSESKTLDQQILAFKTAQSDLSKATQKERIANSFVGKYDLVKSIEKIEAAAAATNTQHQLSITDPYLNKGTVGAAATTTPAEKPKESIMSKQGIDEIPYTMTATNDFLGTVNYMQYLEHLLYFTEISKVELVGEVQGGTNVENGTRAPRTGIIKTKLNGVLYIVKDEGN
ncbi:MAG: hypothetical protein ACM3KM_03150 [Acidobacteriaceae bacterium]